MILAYGGCVQIQSILLFFIKYIFSALHNLIGICDDVLHSKFKFFSVILYAFSLTSIPIIFLFNNLASTAVNYMDDKDLTNAVVKSLVYQIKF